MKLCRVDLVNFLGNSENKVWEFIEYFHHYKGCYLASQVNEGSALNLFNFGRKRFLTRKTNANIVSMAKGIYKGA